MLPECVAHSPSRSPSRSPVARLSKGGILFDLREQRFRGAVCIVRAWIVLEKASQDLNLTTKKGVLLFLSYGNSNITQTDSDTTPPRSKRNWQKPNSKTPSNNIFSSFCKTGLINSSKGKVNDSSTQKNEKNKQNKNKNKNKTKTKNKTSSRSVITIDFGLEPSKTQNCRSHSCQKAEHCHSKRQDLEIGSNSLLFSAMNHLIVSIHTDPSHNKVKNNQVTWQSGGWALFKVVSR